MADVYVALFQPDTGEPRFLAQCADQWAARLVCGSDYLASAGVNLCQSCWSHPDPSTWTALVPRGRYRITRWSRVVEEFLITPPGAGVPQ